MTTRRRAASKKTWMEEAARVMAIWRALYDEFRPTTDALPMADRLALLAVADRIASRTEE